MPQKIIIGLTGQIACGKGVIKKYLIEKYGASDYRFSTILRDIAKRLHIEPSRNNLIDLSTGLRKQFGEDILAHTMAEDLKHDEHNMIIVDGIRRMTDIIHMKKIPGFHLIRVVANEKLRYLRVVFRNENPGDDKKTFEDFLKDQNKETEVTIPEVMSNANYEIINEDVIEKLHEDIERIMTDIINKQK
jgi:dephospho-CoA kinase